MGKIILIALFSCGWLALLFFACSEYFRYLDILMRRELEDYSLSPLYSGEKFFLFTCIWLAAVIFFWSVMIGKRIFPRRQSF
jgi:hypothetical protein